MSTIIFDFDGTLADSFGLVIDIFHELTDGEHRTAPEEVQRLRGMATKDIIKELHIRWWRIPKLVVEGRARMRHRLGEVQPFMAMGPVLYELRERGHELFIVSSNSADNVRHFLKEHDWHMYFDKIYGGVGIFNKAHILKKIMRENHLQPGQCVYVGDETRDVVAAHKANMRCIAVGWGYNTPEILLAQRPFAIVREPEDFLKIFA